LTSISAKHSSSSPDRLPVNAGGFHHDLLDTERLEPVTQRQKPLHGGLKLRDLLGQRAAFPDAQARGHAGLMHIQRARPFNNPLHHQPPSVARR